MDSLTICCLLDTLIPRLHLFILLLTGYNIVSLCVCARRIQYPYPGCKRWLKNSSGLKLHQSSAHSHSFTHPESQCTQHASVEEIEDEEAPRRTNNELWESKHGLIRDYHEMLTGRICDENGNFVDPGTPPPPYTAKSPDDWTPYRNRLEFECADFMYTENQMSAGDINKILYLWGITLTVHRDNPPFADYKDLYDTIDATPLGDVAWESFSLKYNGDKPAGECPLWMEQSHEVWFRDPHTVIKNMLANPDFKGGIDYMPYREFQEKDEQRRYKDFMSGDWAWQQAVCSDKTTVSVATGQNDYYPLYLSIGNVHNNVRRAHRNALALVGFLAIPKTEKRNTDELGYRKFKKQLFHSSLSRIFANLKPGMTTPEVTRCGDGHYWRIIYGLGPYIADYEEQVVLACMVKDWCGRCLAFPSSLDEGGVSRSREHTDALVDSIDFGILWDEYGIIGELVPFTNDFPRADIHELLAPDILHQLIKGTFKDHLVEWVGQYLELTHGKTRAKAILDDIDRRIASAPPFPGLRRFPQGCGFSQWTGDDSKALMKVYLPAIEGHVPDDMVQAFRALLKFCYIVRTNVVTDDTLAALKDALGRFHTYRTIFQTTGLLIRMFGAPNSLCSSITESKHIKAVKQPWRRSSKYNALSQMLLTNQRLDKVAAARVDFTTRSMLKGSCAFSYYNSFVENPSYIDNNDGDPEVQPNPAHAGSNPFAIESDDFDDVEDQERKRARTVADLADELDIPSFPTLIRLFLYDQIHADNHHSSADVPLRDCPSYTGPIKIFHSAAATFIAPSDPSGITGMRREHIRVVPSWRKGPARFDCAFVNTDNRHDGMLSMDVIRIFCFFSFTFTNSHTYPCALVQWFHRIAEERDELTGMWMVAPSFNEDGSRDLSIIHIDSIIRGAHLLPIFGTQLVPRGLRFYDSLDVYRGFYVNRFINHHAFELAS
ncbi:hypothetical protein DFJ58DRAFT_868489 [Suillus subalutaceus]|uniref:uncharacterized protein n=1 Tax=Suillus subalutaceus TaxID=48586 RepID=UPI001B85F25C|nr:uncharacterized protein DFJ58DRAFT_868489 [Suillus subalutaceus]KAG1834931.1 hypothetical protein DFJ58DRAFT_868489 [Suillus subalutaceus]